MGNLGARIKLYLAYLSTGRQPDKSERERRCRRWSRSNSKDLHNKEEEKGKVR